MNDIIFILMVNIIFSFGSRYNPNPVSIRMKYNNSFYDVGLTKAELPLAIK